MAWKQNLRKQNTSPLFDPICLLSDLDIFWAISGNNDVLAGTFVSLFILFAAANHSFWSGALFGVSVVASKALTILSGIPVFLSSKNKSIWFIAASVPVILVYGVWVFLWLDMSTGFHSHGTDLSSGNLPFVLAFVALDITSPTTRWTINAIGATLVLSIASLPIIVRRQTSVPDSIVAYRRHKRNVFVNQRKIFSALHTGIFISRHDFSRHLEGAHESEYIVLHVQLFSIARQ